MTECVRIVGGHDRDEAHPWLAHLLLTSTDPTGTIKMSQCMGTLINRSRSLLKVGFQSASPQMLVITFYKCEHSDKVRRPSCFRLFVLTAGHCVCRISLGELQIAVVRLIPSCQASDVSRRTADCGWTTT